MRPSPPLLPPFLFPSIGTLIYPSCMAPGVGVFRVRSSGTSGGDGVRTVVDARSLGDRAPRRVPSFTLGRGGFW